MRALDSQTLSTTATCFQCDGDGRRAGLKIRSSQEGVGSSPTFGTETSPPRRIRTALTRAAGALADSGGRPRPGWQVWSHPLCMGPKPHFGEWIQFDGRLESGVESCSRIAGSLACSESSSPSNR